MSRIGLNGIEPPLLAVCVVVWNDPAGVNSAAYSTNATINFNKSVVNRYNMWNPSTPNRIMIPVGGFYKVGATIRMGSAHADFSDWSIMLNTDTFVEANTIIRHCDTTTSGQYASTCGATIVKLKAGDFLTVGLPRGFTLFSDATRFWAYEIRGASTAYGSIYVKQ